MLTMLTMGALYSVQSDAVHVNSILFALCKQIFCISIVNMFRIEQRWHNELNAKNAWRWKADVFAKMYLQSFTNELIAYDR